MDYSWVDNTKPATIGNIMGTRYTTKNLKTDLDAINSWLVDAGSLIRLQYGHRYGYSAVDEYSVDSEGDRIDSGINRTIECGSPRQCSDAALLHYRAEVNKVLRKRLAEAGAAEPTTT